MALQASGPGRIAHVLAWALLAGVLGAAPAHAVNMFVEGMAGTWDSGSSFTEDFEDGLLSPTLGSVICGANALSAGDERNGLLRLRPSEPACGGTRIITQFAAGSTGGGSFDATYRYRTPEQLGQGYGLSVGGTGGNLTLGVFAFTNPVNGDEQVIALLFDEGFNFATNFIEFFVLPDENFAFDTISFRLVLTEIGGVLIPHGRLAFDGGPFQDMGENGDPSRPGDFGALPATDGHFMNLFRTGTAVPEPASWWMLAALPWALGRKRGRRRMQSVLKFGGGARVVLLLVAATALLGAKCVAPVGPAGVPDASGEMSFLSPQAQPLALSHDGQVLYVANTSSGTLSLLDVSGAGAPGLIAEVAVGLEPVGVAVRPKVDPEDASEDELVLVTNHVSDSISVVSRGRQEVVQTVQVIGADGVTQTNEPTGVAFSGPGRAFVTLDHPNEVLVLDVDAAGQVTVHPTRLAITAQGPRAIAAAGGKVYVAAFESGNQTEFPTCDAANDPRGLDESDPFDEGCEFDVVVDGAAFVFEPNLGGRIIRDRDQPDRDLFVFDAATLALDEVVDTLGTLHYGLAAHGSTLYLTNTEALNQKDGLAALANRMFDNRLAVIDCSAGCTGNATQIDLDAEAGTPAPTPYGVAVSGDGNLVAVTAFGSDGSAGAPGLFLLDGAGNALGQLPVGALPSGVVLASDGAGVAQTAYVLDSADSTVSVVDVRAPAVPAVDHTVIVGDDPTPADIRRGRIAFANALGSTSGTFSCESCHPQGHTDQLQWSINTVQGPDDPLGTSGEKPEPRTTMPIRGLSGTLPLHWDGTLGDPIAGAFVPGDSGLDCDIEADGAQACFRHLVNASLSGVMCEQPCAGVGELSDDERDDMAAFLAVLPYPPSPLRRPSDAMTADALQGARDFFTNDDGQGSQQILTCASSGAGCHALPLTAGTNSGFVGAFDAPTIRGMWDRFLLFSNGMFQAEEALVLLDSANSVAIWDPNVGHTERGSFLATFPDDPAAVGQGFLGIYGVRGEDIFQMISELGVGFPGILGRQLDLTAATAADADLIAGMDQMEAFATEGRITAVARSGDLGEYRVDPDTGFWTQGVATETGASLRALVAGTPGAVLTITAEHAPAVQIGGAQPLLWGSVGRPQAGAQASFLLQSESVDPAAAVLVDGAVCAACSFALLDAADPKRMVVTLDPAPTVGPHMIQVHNPDGLLSNEMPIVAQ